MNIQDRVDDPIVYRAVNRVEPEEGRQTKIRSRFYLSQLTRVKTHRQTSPGRLVCGKNTSMRFFSRCMLLVLLAVAWSPVRGAFAQKPFPISGDLRFQHLSVEQGLSQSSVNAVLQDSLGFLWIGTADGLNKYDGYQFITYQRDYANHHTLANNAINALLETSTGDFWVGTDAGLERFNRQAETFTHYAHTEGDPASLTSNAISFLMDDGQGAFWVGTNQGLNWYDPARGGFVRYLEDEFISALYKDPAGNIWVGTQRSGLVSLSPQREIVRQYRSDPNDPHGLGDNQVTAVGGSPDGSLFVATRKSGLYRFVVSSGRFDPIPLFTNSEGLNVIRSLQVDQEGRLWVGTSEGLFILAPGAAVPSRWERHDPGDPNSLSNNQVSALYADRGGMVWVGTLGGGLNGYSPYANKFPRYGPKVNAPASISGNVVMALLEDRQGAVWVGTVDGGLSRQDPRTGKFTRFAANGASGSISGSIIQDLAEDPDGSIWVATRDGGLNRYDPTADRFIQYVHDPDNPNSISSNRVVSLLITPDGSLWAGTEAGLNHFERSTGAWKRYQPDPAYPAGLRRSFVGSLVTDLQGRIWISTDTDIEVFDPRRDTFLHDQFDFLNRQVSSAGSYFNSVFPAMNGMIWLGTSGEGLLRVDPDKRLITRYTLRSGLPNDTVYCILSDAKGSLWLSTNKGLSRFDPSAETFRSYDMQDGLQNNEFDSRACTPGKSGRLYFGGITGFNAFYPEQIRDNPHPPSVIITAFKNANRPILKDLRDGTVLSLSYHDTLVSFDYAALDFTAPGQIRYAYKLEGFDPGWIEAGMRRSASYTNLPGGNYTFRVKAANPDGVWNEVGTSIHLQVAPPFWQTWWFRISAVAGLIGAAAVGYWLRIRGLKARQDTLERLIQHRTGELQREVEQRKQVEEDLRLSQALYHEIFDNTHQQIYLIDVLPQGQFRLVTNNPAHQSQTGLVPDGFLGKALDEILPVGAVEAVYRHYQDCIAAGGPIIYEETGASPVWDEANSRVYRTALAPIRDGRGTITRLVGVSTDITEQKRVEAALARQTQEAAVAAERNRLARELHDAVTQTLFSASLIADVLPRIWEKNPQQGRLRLTELRELSRGALAEMRTLLWELRPTALVDAELVELLRQLMEAFIGRSRISACLTTTGANEPSALPAEVKLAFYRIAQEALNNVAKHAGASQVEISLHSFTGQVEVEICDDGCGFDPVQVSRDHLGLGIMSERASSVGAKLEISSQAGRGTRIRVSYRQEAGRSSQDQ